MFSQRIVLLCVGGVLGTLARHFLASAVQSMAARHFAFFELHAYSAFPWGTAAVNLLGCFAFGAVWAMLQTRSHLGEELRLLLLVGFMGAFTTFSTFTHDTAQMLLAKQWFFAVANVIGQTTIGLMGLLAGIAVGRGW